MFFHRKNQKDSARELEEQLSLTKEILQKTEEKFSLLEDILHKTEKEAAEQARQMETINLNIAGLQEKKQKHDMAIEDLLDEWAEKRSAKEMAQKQLSDYSQREKRLLELFEAYQEQFWNLKHFADSKDTAWAEQIALMEKNLEHFRQLCGICIIGECGTEINYDLHEAIKAVSTTDPSKDKTVAAIYSCGYIYKGTVKKKAQVSAYRLETEEI